MYIFCENDYKKSKKRIIDKIYKKFNKKIIIRSSASDEDQFNNSQAGKYTSVLNIDSNNKEKIEESIKKVIKSFKNKGNKNEIFVQRFLSDIEFSGVITTCDITNYSPYYVINYFKGKDTAAITSGNNKGKTQLISKYKTPNKKFVKVINLAKELEQKFKNNFLDIEFGVSKKKLYLFQVRPLTSIDKNETIDYKTILKKLEKKINKLKKQNHNLYGKTTFFGVMPDWNPAEIIGIKPKPLSLSLYKELITDRVWALNRKDYGFKDMSNNQLMTNFFGTPYIDVRVDFNSWIPRNLNKKLSEKLVNYYLKQFYKSKSLHDKIEFEILLTCYSPLTLEKIKSLKENGFSKVEINKIVNSLKKINQLVIKNSKKNRKMINQLQIKQDQIIKSKMYYIDKIHWLIEDCKKFGTYPFAGDARAAFCAIEILNGFVKKKILTENEKERFISSLKTVTSEMQIDFHNLNKNKFLLKYGHLRPNTYEIDSLNYREGYKIYFDKKLNKNIDFKKIGMTFTQKQKQQIKKFIKNSNLNISFENFIKFLKESIKNREYTKFIFTKSINLVLKILLFIAKRFNIKREDISYLNIQDILKLYYSLSINNVKDNIEIEIKKNKEEYKKNINIKLPEVILTSKNVYEYEEKENKINFISNKSVFGETYLIKNLKKFSLDKKIIIIESADPGYDFIFNYNIKGLITKYGGVNSHMSIRCAELKIPAAIGVGNYTFEKIINKKIILDCVSKKIVEIN